MTKITARRVFSLVAFAVAAALAHPVPSAAFPPEWLQGTSVATAYDKAVAHDLALTDAVARIRDDCSGNLAGLTEDKVVYEQDPSTGEWHAQVVARALCHVR
ncbi:MAG TPA: hypothetical protein VN603_03530 [Candidatus Acidoferrales bacterium]|nr:hypothetical protein [Candidatus Acidoferrales bacterium]